MKDKKQHPGGCICGTKDYIPIYIVPIADILNKKSTKEITVCIKCYTDYLQRMDKWANQVKSENI